MFALWHGLTVEARTINVPRETFSSGNLALFKRHNLPGLSDVETFDKVLTIDEIEENRRGWDPGNYRGDTTKDAE